ncbi:MAG TPA: hypothetical protein VIO64_15725 [Pseudobacteroides sp.]|uniref:hypothetical protein n=1 Tax=Pseudobacteroides sp. TaxID=1968840 RepID=UPI002F946904
MAVINAHKITREVLLQETASRVGELETYVSCVIEMKKDIYDSGAKLKSKGLKKISEAIKNKTEEDTFKAMEKELPDLLKGLRKISSVSLGINFNAELNPVEFTIVSVNDEPYKEIHY